MTVTIEDLEKLKSEPTEKVKTQVAKKIAEGFNGKNLNRVEISLSLEIFRLLTQDESEQVRKVLSETLKENIDLPHDIALKLAKDVEEVAVPMLEYSYVLTEDDLIDIVKEAIEIGKIISIAKRETVSANLSKAILDKNFKRATHTLISNQSAGIKDKDLQGIIDNIEDYDSDILKAVSRRKGLSHDMVLTLIEKSPDSIKTQLIDDYKLPIEVVPEPSGNIGDDSENTKIYKLEEAVEKLYQENQLNYSVLIRALCSGDLEFFEVSMAKLVGIPVNNARILILDKGELGFRSIYESSPLPKEFYNAIKIILNTILEVTNFGKIVKKNIKNELRQKIIENGYDQTVEYMDYFLKIMRDTDDQHIHTQANG